MAQKAVETLLGRLLTDEDFRRRFFDEPLAVCRQEALEVTSRELEAILAVDEVRFAQFAKQLDARIVRATLRRDVGSAVTRASASRKRLAR
jgi:predicted DNA-binding protein (UPF0251 family)